MCVSKVLGYQKNRRVAELQSLSWSDRSCFLPGQKEEGVWQYAEIHAGRENRAGGKDRGVGKGR